MADLTKYVWSGIRSGMAVDLYLNRWPSIGSGTADVIEPLRAHVRGSGSVLGIKFNLDVEVRMPDLSSSGTCTVTIGGRSADCRYTTSGGKLIINHPDAQIVISDNDKYWTWISVNSPVAASVGVWPAGMNADADAFFLPARKSR